MAKKRLQALGYLEWDKVDVNNDGHFRKVVVWLEDQRIRLYPIEDRQALREIGNDNWPAIFADYCKDLQCPVRIDNPLGQLEWLLGRAMWLQFGNDHDRYREIAESKAKLKKESAVPTLTSANPLDRLDFENEAFVAGTRSLARLLRVPDHSDHLVTLQAVARLVKARLSEQSAKEPVIHRGKQFPVYETKCGFAIMDKKVEKAAKGLALIYIQDLRELQTKINESIVAVQSVTANPKTDTKLGKVGK